MEEKVIERLQAKSPEEAFMARTQFEQMRRYFEEYYELKRDVGQMTFFAVSEEVPPGQPIAVCKREAITLTLDHPDDMEALRHGVAALRQSKIQRLTQEAREQGALLTQEDLARLLCASRSTVKRDIAHLRKQGIDVPTRGQIKDIGKGISHKAQIVEDWLAGYTFSQIKQRRRHSIHSIERYCSGFSRVVRLHEHGLSLGEIRGSTGLSERLIGEYLILYEAAGPENECVQRILGEADSATETPAEIKRGDWLQ
jgi:biotin operon repressor